MNIEKMQLFKQLQRIVETHIHMYLIYITYINICIYIQCMCEQVWRDRYNEKSTENLTF